MNATEVMKALEKMGSPQTRKIYLNHGGQEPLYGVKVADLKTLVKRIKIDTPLARQLYQTGNMDAMYLAGLIAKGSDLTRTELTDWAKRASCPMISEYTVPWVTTESPEGWRLALEWIDSPEDKVAASGWGTLAGKVATQEDKDLDLKALEKLMDRVVKTIHQSPNRSRYAMNMFVICVGSYVKPLTKNALEVAGRIDEVKVDMGGTACQVPRAADYIRKTIARGYKKRRTMKC